MAMFKKTHRNKENNFVNERTINGVKYQAYRIPSNKGGGAIIVVDGKAKASKNLKSEWNKII